MRFLGTKTALNGANCSMLKWFKHRRTLDADASYDSDGSNGRDDVTLDGAQGGAGFGGVRGCACDTCCEASKLRLYFVSSTQSHFIGVHVLLLRFMFYVIITFISIFGVASFITCVIFIQDHR